MARRPRRALPALAALAALALAPAAAAGAAGAPLTDPRPDTSPAAAPEGATLAAASDGPYAWARPAARRIARDLGWPGMESVDLGGDAARRGLARALAAVLSDELPRRPVALSDVRRGDPQREEIEAVVAAGVLPAPGGRFRPDAPVTLGAARTAMVRALGFEAERRAVGALRAGDRRLDLPPGAGGEVLARELGLVANIPSSLERLERRRTDRMRFADLAYMADAARSLSRSRAEGARRHATIELPDMGADRRRVVRAALSTIGTPYVWGGEWPGPASPAGRQAVGGYDCSGLVWWAFSGAPAVRGAGLGRGLGGRTTADHMAFSRTGGARVPLDRTAPGDLVFFGPEGRRSRRGDISHMGIALGGGWMVHSAGSRGGTSISHLSTYWPDGAAFARRPPALGTSPAAGPSPITLSASQLRINQRIGQAAVRRLNALEARLVGRPVPAARDGGGGRVTLSARQLRINQRIYQAGVRRAGALEARLAGRDPRPDDGAGDPGRVRLSATQLRINQRIAQAAVRRANSLAPRVEAALASSGGG